jgi:putative DNA primase/helicase
VTLSAIVTALITDSFHKRSDWMTINRLNLRKRIFSNASIERPLIPAADQATSVNADNLSRQEDSPQGAPPPSTLTLPAEATATAGCADLVCLCDLQPQPVQWLWQNRLAIGSLAMISGAPGSGKTWIALAIAAALSRGRAPGLVQALELPLEPCTVLYASMEHDSSEIIQPRFASLNGDPARLVVLRGAVSTPSPAVNLRDPSILENALQRTQARLVILDSFHSSFGDAVDLDQPAEALPLLQSLARLADRHRCCILLIRHLSKRGLGRPPLRSYGSVHISAALRTEFLAGSGPDAPSQPALLQVKSNLGPLAPPLSYRIDDDGFFWTGRSKLTLEEMLAVRPSGAGLPKRKFAAEWLLEYLQEGSQSQFTVETAAERDGVSVATLRRAKFDIGVCSAKDGIKGVWYWSLPTAADQQKST